METANAVKRLYGCIYRSPNSSEHNNSALIENLEWATENFSEVLLTGDFKLPGINWDQHSATSANDKLFLETIDAGGLDQLVEEPTRYRAGQSPSLLDIILTTEQGIVADIVQEEAFGKSDHSKIVFTVRNVYEKKSSIPFKYNFHKMNEQIFISEM